jgi:hypothetical protein
MPTDTKTALLMTAERAAPTRGFDGFSYADATTPIRKPLAPELMRLNQRVVRAFWHLSTSITRL